MKKSLLYFFLLSFYLHCQGQTVASNCLARANVIDKYMNDADRLAIRRVNHVNSSYKDSVAIHPQIKNDYLSALIAVHNASNLPAVDTITRFLNIHTYNPGLNSLVVVADSNLVWMSNLRYHATKTHEDFIDNMMLRYDLKQVFYSGLLQPSMVVFKTDRNCNLAPLAKKIKRLIGVAAAEAEFLYGDGNDIKDSITEKYIELTYSYGWQECSFGCELRRFWKFRVYSDCSVEYIQSYGSPLDRSILLTLEKDEKSLDELNVYSNPIKPIIYLDASSLRLLHTSVSITDKNGKVVYSAGKINKHHEIDLILMSVGFYTMELKNNTKTKIYKIRKQ